MSRTVKWALIGSGAVLAWRVVELYQTSQNPANLTLGRTAGDIFNTTSVFAALNPLQSFQWPLLGAAAGALASRLT